MPIDDDDPAGYGRPPKRFQFPKGVSGNPRGRPKQAAFSLAGAIARVLDGTTSYREHGTTRKTSRRELTVRNQINRALGGDVQSAAMLLKLLIHAGRHGDIGTRKVFVKNWLRDHPGQTGPEKTRQFAAAQHTTERAHRDNENDSSDDAPTIDTRSSNGEKNDTAR
jgi:Family of unknown function (DUF5681)